MILLGPTRKETVDWCKAENPYVSLLNSPSYTADTGPIIRPENHSQKKSSAPSDYLHKLNIYSIGKLVMIIDVILS